MVYWVIKNIWITLPVFTDSLFYSEVLSAPDRELNAWSSLKKTCSYRDDNEELRDIDSYKFKAKDVQLKRKILPSIFNEDGPEQALAAEKDKRAVRIFKGGPHLLHSTPPKAP